MYSNIMLELETNIVNLPRLAIPTVQILNFAAGIFNKCKETHKKLLTIPGKNNLISTNSTKIEL